MILSWYVVLAVSRVSLLQPCQLSKSCENFRVWDEADYVVPPAENGAFFITTNVLITPNQTQGRCVENYLVKGASCNVTSKECVRGKYLKKGHGIMTG